MNDISYLTSLAKKFRDDRDWKKIHTPKDVAMDISIEAAELLEHFLWKEGSELDRYIEHHKKDISDEMSDVLHGILILAEELGIDIIGSFEEKMKKNEQKYPVSESKGRNVKHTDIKRSS